MSSYFLILTFVDLFILGAFVMLIVTTVANRLRALTWMLTAIGAEVGFIVIGRFFLLNNASWHSWAYVALYCTGRLVEFVGIAFYLLYYRAGSTVLNSGQIAPEEWETRIRKIVREEIDR